MKNELRKKRCNPNGHILHGTGHIEKDALIREMEYEDIRRSLLAPPTQSTVGHRQQRQSRHHVHSSNSNVDSCDNRLSILPRGKRECSSSRPATDKLGVFLSTFQRHATIEHFQRTADSSGIRSAVGSTSEV